MNKKAPVKRAMVVALVEVLDPLTNRNRACSWASFNNSLSSISKVWPPNSWLAVIVLGRSRILMVNSNIVVAATFDMIDDSDDEAKAPDDCINNDDDGGGTE